MNLGEYLANLLLEQDQKTIALFPGAFKPPHKGHFAVVKDLADKADEVVVLISPKSREGISAEESFEVWKLYDTQLPDNVSFRIATESPVSETYDVVKNNPDTKFLVAFGKGEMDRFKQFQTTDKYNNVTVYDAGVAEEGISATGLRNALQSGNEEEIKKYLPQNIDITDFKNALGYKSALMESPPLEFENDTYQNYITDNRVAIERAADYFNIPIPDMEYAFVAGDKIILGDDVWSKLQNSNSWNIQNLEQVIRYAHEKNAKIKPYFNSIKAGEELPLPLVLRYGSDKYWLVGGEIILSLYRALKIIPSILQATLNLSEVQSAPSKPNKKQIITEFIKYVAEELELKTLPKIKFSTDTEEVKNRRSFGYFNPGQNVIWVYTKNRNMADMLRTLAHELVHHKQNLDGRIHNDSGETGSEIENEANAKAGVILRNFGKQNSMIYEGLSKGKTLLNIAQIHAYDDSSDSTNKAKINQVYNILKKELKKGIQVEKEHTNNVKKAARIAMDHLIEDPKYYTKLAKIGLEEKKTKYREYVLSELFEKDLPNIDKISNKEYIVGNGNDIEAKYIFKLEIPERNIWSLSWDYTPNNKNTSTESWKQITATSFKVLSDFLKNNNPKSLHISGNTESKTSIYKNYIEKLQTLLNNRYKIDNSDEYKVVLRSIEEAAKDGIKKRMETLNESYDQALDYFQNGNINSKSKIEKNNSLLKQIKREVLKKIYDINEDQKYELYCDMDGVIVDFERGYEELTGKDIRGNHVKGDANFWQPITDADVKFWASLKWMPDGKQLWDYIKKHKPNLLSAPSREESSKIGKYVWVKRNIPGFNLILRSAERKQEFASPNAILIDDRADNIQRWKDAGGIGILHTSAENTINELEKLGL